MIDKPKPDSGETAFSVRLRAARKMAGLSMEGLAERIGGMVTKQAIGKYEKGLMMPAPEVMERLIQVLPGRLRKKQEQEPEDEVERALACFSVEKMQLPDPQMESSKPEDPAHVGRAERFLISVGYPSLADRRARLSAAWEFDAAINQIRFREGERLPAKTKSALENQVAEYLQKYLELESILGLAATLENPVVNLPVRTSDEAEAAASEVRRRWELGSGPVVNLLGLLEDMGVAVYETRGIDGFDGLSGRFGIAPFVAVGLDFPADRVRFTAAHELAHIMCEFSGNESPESMCHAFAGAFLLPKAALEKAFAPSRRKVSLGELGEIKMAFGISLQAIMYRAHALRLVSDRQLRAFRETVKAKGWSRTEPVEYAGKETATRFHRLLHYAVAADILDVERAAAIAGVSPEKLKNEIGEIF